MPHGWDDYFFMIGSSAAALIGLMFIVVTLTAGRDRQEVERGKSLYTSPIVFDLAVILVVSGAAIAPAVGARIFGWASVCAAVAGLAISLRSTFGIARRPGAPEAAVFDILWYGVAPALVYAGLVVAASAILIGKPWGVPALAACLMALLLVSIHAEWDLVTYLAPIAGSKDQPRP